MNINEYLDKEYIPALLRMDKEKKDNFFMNQFYEYLILLNKKNRNQEERTFVRKYNKRLYKNYSIYLGQLKNLNRTVITKDKDYAKLPELYKDKTEQESIFLYWDNLNKKIADMKKRKSMI